MKKFIYQTVFFLSLISLIFFYVFSLADGYTDPFYMRFTTPKQNNLILGTSRAAQGIQPKELTKILGMNFNNYAFTIMHSPFGETYLSSIKKKLNDSNEERIFIVAVDPWSISSSLEKPNNKNSFRELNRCLSNTPIVDMNPNVMYLMNNLGGNYYRLLKPIKGKVFLHKDGWLEVSVAVRSKESVAEKITDFGNRNLKRYHYSTLRYAYLKKTISYLKNKGKVYLVRLPVPQKMLDLENELLPDFNEKILALNSLTSGYLNMNHLDEEFIFNDGNHLHKSSGKKASKIIGQWIKNHK